MNNLPSLYHENMQEIQGNTTIELNPGVIQVSPEKPDIQSGNLTERYGDVISTTAPVIKPTTVGPVMGSDTGKAFVMPVPTKAEVSDISKQLPNSAEMWNYVLQSLLAA